MKNLFSLFTTCLIALTASSQIQPVAVLQPGVAIAPENPRKIQIAILFDTSGSMDGLIEQAKTTIWQIVNAASDLRIGDAAPLLEIALYDYRNSTIANATYVRQHVNLINDLDSISGKLFALSINGGDEYCAAVIEDALANLQWSTDPNDLKIIYIAGNEPFNQGPVDYKKILKDAANRNIIVNTIYCGPYDQGVTELWYDGALVSQGNYFNIDSDREAFHVDTPYDKEINSYNDSLNTTYMGYGESGKYRAQKQTEEDSNAGKKGAGVASERAESKAKSNYKNSSWDLVDAKKENTLKLEELKDEDLPDDLKGKTLEEKEKIIAEKSEERARYQATINELAQKRSEFINEEKKKHALESGQEDLGTSIIKSMNTSAEKMGYKIK